MILQIRKWGDSNVLVLSPGFMDYKEFKEGDWIDVSDIVKVKSGLKMKNEQTT